MNYTEFYSDGPYASFAHEIRAAGTTPAQMILSDQKAHEFRDPATTDLVTGLITRGTTRARWRWDSRWREVASRRPGDMGISPLDTPLDFQIFGSHQILLLIFPFTDLQTRYADQGVKVPSDFGNLQGPAYWRDPLASRLLRAMWGASKHPSQLANLFVDSALDAFFTLVIEKSTRKVSHATPKGVRSTLSNEQIRQIQERLRDVRNHPVKIASEAANCGMSVETFRKQFRSTVGVPFARYAMLQRMEMAKDLLRDSARSLVDISIELGFSDQSHFTKTFLQHLGETPNSFRTRKLGK